MKINRDIVEYSGNTEIITEAYGLTNVALIADILSNMYSDPIMAVIREYVANALDSHFMAGKADVPIRIIIPNINHLFFEVHDFGLGLDDVEAKRLWKYGDSNKNHTDDVIGGFGIGSKAGFSYTNNFEVITTKNGIKRSYITFKNEAGAHTELVLEEPTDEGNGVVIKIPVKATDINAFREKAQTMLQWLEVQPEVIGMKIYPVEYEFKGDGYYILKNNFDKIYVKMGNVVYDTELYSDQFSRDVVLNYPIGAFRIAPSRENIIVKTEDQEKIFDRVKEIYEVEKKRVESELKSQKSLFRAYKLHKQLNEIFTAEMDFNWKGRDSIAVTLAKAISRGRGKSLKIYPDVKKVGIDQIRYIYDIEGKKKGYLEALKETYSSYGMFGSTDYMLVIDTTNPKQALRDWLAAGRPEVPFIRYSDIAKTFIPKTYDRKPVMFKLFVGKSLKVIDNVEIDINDGYPYKYVNVHFNKFLNCSIYSDEFKAIVQNAGIKDDFLIVPSSLSKSLPANWICLDKVLTDAVEQVKDLYEQILLKKELISCSYFKDIKKMVEQSKEKNIRFKGLNADLFEYLFPLDLVISPEEEIIKTIGKDVLHLYKDTSKKSVKYISTFRKLKEKIENNYPVINKRYNAFSYLDNSDIQYIDLMNKHVYNMETTTD